MILPASHFTATFVRSYAQEFEKLVMGDEKAAYADKAYPSVEHRAFLASKGIVKRETRLRARMTTLLCEEWNK